MKVEVEVKITILEGKEEGRTFVEKTIANTEQKYTEYGVIETLRLEWNKLVPYDLQWEAKPKGEQRMTNEQAIEMMKAKLECMTREVSGTDQMCNAKKCDDCYLCYEQGNMGEQKEWLRMGIKALESQKTGHWILDETDNSITCNKCGCLIWANDISDGEAHYCPNCGAKMKGDNNE